MRKCHGGCIAKTTSVQSYCFGLENCCPVDELVTKLASEAAGNNMKVREAGRERRNEISSEKQGRKADTGGFSTLNWIPKRLKCPFQSGLICLVFPITAAVDLGFNYCPRSQCFPPPCAAVLKLSLSIESGDMD